MAESGVTIPSIQSLVLDLPPSCIEFCPNHPDYFLVGTYNLQKDDQVDGGNRQTGGKDAEDEEPPKPERKAQSRNGSIIVFRLEDRSIHHAQTLAYPSAILDLRFEPTQPSSEISRCAVVSSTGTLSTFAFTPSPAAGHQKQGRGLDILAHSATYRLPGAGEDVLFLSFCWHPTAIDVVAITTSTGKVFLVRLRDNGQEPGSLGMLEPLITTGEGTMTHTLEAWTVAIAPPFPDPTVSSGEASPCFTVYSGGDDSALRYVSFSSSEEDNSTDPAGDTDESSLRVPFPAVSLKGHSAGVTAILPLAQGLVVTGSYDDHLRVFLIHDLVDTNGACKTLLLAEENLGGGVWRLKLVGEEMNGETSRRRWRILASCMHAGVRVIDVELDLEGDCQVNVLARFTEHRSMNYGSDFRVDEGGDGSSDGFVGVSTSFYDKLLCLWEFPS